MKRFAFVIMLWLVPWVLAFGIFKGGYNEERGELISLGKIAEFRQNLGELDRQTGLKNPIPFPADNIQPADSSRGLLLFGDSFAGIMSGLIRDWIASGYNIPRYAQDGNHKHGHRSPRRALLEDFQDPSFDWSGFSDVIMVELEHQGGVSWIQDPAARSGSKKTASPTWHDIKPRNNRSVLSEFIQFCEWNLFPSRIPGWLIELNRGMPIAPDAPLRLTDGSPVERISLMTGLDPGWRGEPNWDWIRYAVADYQLLDSLCRQRNMHFQVAYVPDRTTVYAEWLGEENPERLRAHYNALTHALDSAGMDMIPVLALIDSAHAAGDSNLYLLHDNHWNFHGCAIIATEILRGLEQPIRNHPASSTRR